MSNKKLPLVKSLTNLVKHVKSLVPKKGSPDAKDYCDEYTDTPIIQITVGWDPASGDWDWQSGDNSYTGGAYGYDLWAVVYVTKRCNSWEVAHDIRDQLEELTW